MRNSLSTLSLIPVIVGLLVPAVADLNAAEPDFTAPEVLDRVRRSLFAFSSIQFQYKWQYVGVRRGEASNEAVYGNAGEFAYADGKFFSDYYITVGKESSHGYSAFDGELYQAISPNTSRLGVSPGLRVHTPYVAILPIMKPCASFLGYEDQEGGLRFDIDSHRTPAMWHPVQTTAELNQAETVLEHPCAVVSFTHGSGRLLQRFKLYAATDLNFYPVRVIRQTGEASKERTVTIDVTQLADRKTASGRTLVPLRIETITVDAIGTQLGREAATIDAESLKINEPIASDRFYLKRLMPETIVFAANVTPQQQARYEQGPK